MEINVALAKEIYGKDPWMLEGATFHALRSLLRNSSANQISISDKERLNSISTYEISSGNKTKYQKLSERRNGTDGETEVRGPIIAVTLINGTITKSGGASSVGMKEIASDLAELDNNPDVIGHIIQVDSGGGSSSGMEVMQYALSQIKKPKVGLVERSGMAASAAYGIISYTDWVMAEDNNSEVGSIGTMISFSGFPSGEKDFMGEMQITAYATASTKKNEAFMEAINTGKTDLIVSDILDPFNERFMSNMKERRENILDTQLDGSMYNAGDVIGTMVDQIGSFNDAINKILELSNTKTTFNENLNKNQTKAMTPEEIKAKFPDTHSAIFASGVAAGTQSGIEAEQERVKSWQVYAAVDPEAVNKGIASGKAISQSETHAFLLKASSKNTLELLNKNSNETVVTPEPGVAEATPEVVAKQKEVKDLFALATFNKN